MNSISYTNQIPINMVIEYEFSTLFREAEQLHTHLMRLESFIDSALKSYWDFYEVSVNPAISQNVHLDQLKDCIEKALGLISLVQNDFRSGKWNERREA